MDKKPKTQFKLSWIIRNRYYVCLLLLVIIFFYGRYLMNNEGLVLKETLQICTGLCLGITILFTALNFEYNAAKVSNDYKNAIYSLSYQVASEWYKQPISDYLKNSIKYEDEFVASKPERDVDYFMTYFSSPERIDFKEHLKGILNYLETISIALKNGLIDENFIRDFHKSNFETYYKDYYLFINRLRIDKTNPLIFSNFTTVAERWNPNLKKNVIEKKVVSEFINIS